MGEDTPKSKRKRTPFEEREKQILCQIIKEVDVGVCPMVAALLLLDKERDLLVLVETCGQQLLQRRQLLHCMSNYVGWGSVRLLQEVDSFRVGVEEQALLNRGWPSSSCGSILCPRWRMRDGEMWGRRSRCRENCPFFKHSYRCAVIFIWGTLQHRWLTCEAGAGHAQQQRVGVYCYFWSCIINDIQKYNLV